MRTIEVVLHYSYHLKLDFCLLPLNEEKSARCYCCRCLRHNLGREYLNTNQHKFFFFFFVLDCSNS